MHWHNCGKKREKGMKTKIGEKKDEDQKRARSYVSALQSEQLDALKIPAYVGVQEDEPVQQSHSHVFA